MKCLSEQSQAQCAKPCQFPFFSVVAAFEKLLFVFLRREGKARLVLISDLLPISCTLNNPPSPSILDWVLPGGRRPWTCSSLARPPINASFKEGNKEEEMKSEEVTSLEKAISHLLVTQTRPTPIIYVYSEKHCLLPRGWACGAMDTNYGRSGIKTSLGGSEEEEDKEDEKNRMAGRDGETATGSPENVETDDDKSSLNSDRP
ncbi:hypothetical protein EYF80_023292 [Liparis tanakae]|uniref:Uncharacterized protein n=1 Tax=Liparis tanakae TaxID=230148 RepID=A0A4Z2HKT7_9TELE|nr:hypothetical protein EYF80_023292 [Liparis tanakae]